jgi:hypothetical protein
MEYKMNENQPKRNKSKVSRREYLAVKDIVDHLYEEESYTLKEIHSKLVSDGKISLTYWSFVQIRNKLKQIDEENKLRNTTAAVQPIAQQPTAIFLPPNFLTEAGKMNLAYQFPNLKDNLEVKLTPPQSLSVNNLVEEEGTIATLNAPSTNNLEENLSSKIETTDPENKTSNRDEKENKNQNINEKSLPQINSRDRLALMEKKFKEVRERDQLTLFSGTRAPDEFLRVKEKFV